MQREPRQVSAFRAFAASCLALTLVLGLPSPAGSQLAPTLPGPVSGWSTSTGTDGRVYIADELGRARRFHGFNHKTDDPNTLTHQLLADAAERGMDHVRLSVYWHMLEPAEGEVDQDYLDRVVAAMDRAEAHGILVILSMHQDVFGPAFGFGGIPEWATRTDGHEYVRRDVWLLNYLEPAVQAAFDNLYEHEDLRQYQIRAWLTIVEAAKDHPTLLGYDLLNEPFGRFRPGEGLLEGAARIEREQLTPMFQRLTDAISAVDPDHWVFIKPPNVASIGVATSMGNVTGPKVGFYPHMYDPAIEGATYSPGGVIEYDPDFFALWAGSIATYVEENPMPMLIGEWGVAHPEVGGMDAFVRDSLDTLDEVGSGWSVFNWCRGGGYCPLSSGGNDRPGIGQIFRPYARAIAGAPTSTAWDFEAQVLEVVFVDDGANGPTEIFIPESRSYPAGWEVETTAHEGTWSHSFDPETGVLAVHMPTDGGEHTICVKPEGAPRVCPKPDPDTKPTTTTTTVVDETTTTTTTTIVDETTTTTTDPASVGAGSAGRGESDTGAGAQGAGLDVGSASGAAPVRGQPRYTG